MSGYWAMPGTPAAGPFSFEIEGALRFGSRHVNSARDLRLDVRSVADTVTSRRIERHRQCDMSGMQSTHSAKGGRRRQRRFGGDDEFQLSIVPAHDFIWSDANLRTAVPRLRKGCQG
jgi:hypothetical protein